METCIFCKIAGGEMETRLVYEDDRVIAFNDIDPQAPVHILIIPREHFPSLKEMTDGDLIGHLFVVAKKLAEQNNLAGYRLVINTGKKGGQAVFHVHLHLLGGRQMTWPPG